MDWFRKLVQFYLDNHKKLDRWKKIVSVMAIIVVFITTFSVRRTRYDRRIRNGSIS